MENGEKQPRLFPSALQPGKKYGFVKAVHVHGLSGEEKQFLLANPAVIQFHGFSELRAHPAESLDVLFVGEGFSETSNAEVWGRLCEVLAPGGQIRCKFPLGITKVEDANARLLLGGFINSSVTSDLVAIGEKPTWKPAAALPLKKKNKVNVWAAAEITDIVDEDALLGENDCGGTLSPTGVSSIPVKKKACKNCSCGLAEAEKVTVDISAGAALEEQPAKDASGCGNCAKGDAFRCGGCPYLGTPAFTPGTKPQLVVKADGTKSLMLDMTSEI